MKFLEINTLKTYFHTRSGTVRAVDDVSFSIEKGEIVGELGKSGRATGPHLDIRLNWFDVKLDPMSILQR